MSFITRLKSWATGKAGNSVLKERTVADAPSVATLSAQLQQRLETLDRTLESRYCLNDIHEKNYEGVSKINAIVDTINEHILNAPPIMSRALHPSEETPPESTGERILLERRSFDRIAEDIPPNDGLMIIQGDIVVKVNNTLYDALCDTERVVQRFKSGNISIYHLFPKEVVNDIRKMFISRTQLNTEFQYIYKEKPFTLVLSEFVKSGLYYHKIQVIGLRDTLHPHAE